jgi:hypothetical protein
LQATKLIEGSPNNKAVNPEFCLNSFRWNWYKQLHVLHYHDDQLVSFAPAGFPAQCCDLFGKNIVMRKTEVEARSWN